MKGDAGEVGRLNLIRWEPGMKQSAHRERLRRKLAALLPEYDFTLYPIEILRPWQREFDRPAWSIGVRPKEGGNLVSVYSQDTISDVLLFGPYVVTKDRDSVMVIADWPERTEESIDPPEQQ